MCHVSFDEMTGSESTAERQLSSKNSRSDDSGQALGVLASIGRVRSADAKHLKHSSLGIEDRTATDSANFERRHGHRDLERAPQTIQ